MSRILPFLKRLSRRLPGHDWAEQLDFAGPRVRTAGWSWAVLGAGVLALLVVADQGEAQQQSTAEAQAQLKRLSKADRALRLERAAKAELRNPKGHAQVSASSAWAPEVPVPPKLDDQTLSEAVAVATLMAYPWPDVLRDVSQRAMDHKVVLTAFSLDLSGWDAGTLPVPAARLQAAVSSDEIALRWAADLPEGQLKTRSSLQTPFTGPWGSYALKAEVQARWAPGAQP